MTFTYAADDAESALTGAAAATKAFLSERQRLFVDPVRSYLTAIVKQGASGGNVAEQGLTNEVQETIVGLELRRQAALNRKLALQGSGTVLEAARITSAGDRGDLEVPLATGIGLGALAGVAFAMMRARRTPAGSNAA
jgi:hypothetical protein